MRGLTQRFRHHLYQQSPPFDVNDRPHQARNAAAPPMAKRIGRCHAQQTVAPPLSQMDQRLCAILRGDVLSRAQHDALMASPHLLVTLETHGITSLIYHNLRRQHVDADHQDKGWQGKGWAALA
ncbi:hypothetical protein C2W62_38215 [Candidatus Entotheonella serta]|nr:hypothetical protein C2W62_38215 [Candidatus Entotheonella serta]